MTLTAFAITDPDGFVMFCDKLRKAGVMKLGALVLGPLPTAPTAARPIDPEAEARRRHETMFAATSIRPPFVAPAPPEAALPRAIVQRRARNGSANGEGSSR